VTGGANRGAGLMLFYRLTIFMRVNSSGLHDDDMTIIEREE
jgi:hypothetical protein